MKGVVATTYRIRVEFWTQPSIQKLNLIKEEWTDCKKIIQNDDLKSFQLNVDVHLLVHAIQ